MSGRLNSQVDIVNSIVSRDGDFKRTPPRPTELQEADYMGKFDADTILYDAYRTDTHIRLTCPPLLNLEDEVISELARAVGPTHDVLVSNLDRVSHIDISDPTKTIDQVQVSFGTKEYLLSVTPSRLEDYSNKTVLLSKSKNNDLQWLSDWAKYYATQHHVDAILLYDNGSTEYTAEQARQAITVEGIEVATVVSWPFRFGPQGGKWSGSTKRPWDSDFCEYGIIEHARHKYLGKSSVLISHDIDELLVVEDNNPILEHLKTCKADYLQYSGIWIEDIRDNKSEPPRFQDYQYANSKGTPTTTKWLAHPQKIQTAKQWKTHSVNGAQAETNPFLKHRHFKGITTNWKWDRSESRDHPKAGEIVDYALRSNLENAFQLASISAPPGAAYTKEDALLRHAYLEDVRREMNPYRWTKRGMNRLWYWKSNVLVVDFDQGGAGYRHAFELRILGDRTILIATGRDEKSIARLKGHLPSTSSVFNDSDRHWELDWWRLFVAPKDVAMDCVQFVSGLLPHLERR
ncbi:hypothetical protein [Brevibacterium aurantiacum]|uniref:Glycosyltransferase family 92 protein n=1 Tax=Brevibacterium aurantiacum TaxID=273384 RepID=A0A556C902_BREAU|nr:hypothetical protein [Brevibacterium aurantiacum]TSI13933.1 hypothetical protein FO013_16625 [Brevibacterium aurantiacum]